MLRRSVCDGNREKALLAAFCQGDVGPVDSFVRAQAYLGVEYDLHEITASITDLFTDGLRSRFNGAL